MAGGDVQHIASRQHVHRLHLRARFVVQVLFEMAADAYDRLRRRSMAMHRHHGAGLDGVEHPLRLVFRRVAEIQVHAEAGRSFGLFRQIVQYLIVYYHIRSILKCCRHPSPHIRYKETRGVGGEDGEEAGVFGEAAEEGDGLFQQFRILRAVGVILVVAEVAGVQHYATNLPCFTRPAAASLKEWHGLFGHTQPLHGKSPECLPFRH